MAHNTGTRPAYTLQEQANVVGCSGAYQRQQESSCSIAGQEVQWQHGRRVWWPSLAVFVQLMQHAQMFSCTTTTAGCSCNQVSGWVVSLCLCWSFLVADVLLKDQHHCLRTVSKHLELFLLRCGQLHLHTACLAPALWF